MKVSVIIPVYNMASFVEECICSVQRQTLKDIEIIVVDDGSTDNSRDIIANCCVHDDRIQLLCQENCGAGPARNLGLSIASGDYVAFLDSDDYYYAPDALERMVNACERNQIPICASYRNELKNGRIVQANMFYEFGELPPEGRKISFSEYQNDFFYQSYIYQRAFLQRYSISFPNYRRYEDPPFLFKALDCAKDVWLIPTTLHCYRKGHQNWKQNGIYVADSLSGLRDNLLLAERKYPKLYQELINRIQRMYWQDIINNPSPRLNQVLLQINAIAQRNDPRHEDLPIVRLLGLH